MTEKRRPGRPRKNIINNIPIQNGLSEAILGFTPGGMGNQLSQVDTLFVNNRWYLLSNMRQQLSQMYVEHGLVQTLIDVPVDDGLRGGIEIKTKLLSPEQVEELQAFVDRQDILNSVIGQAMKWNRLYGGAGIIVITDQDPTTPLHVDSIYHDSELDFRAVDMWELFYDKQSTEGYDITSQEHKFEHYNFYGQKIHKTRVMKLKGLTAPSFVRPRLRGWGFSVVESLVQSLNQHFKAKSLSFEVLDEFKLDIFKIKNLTQTLLTAEGTAAVQRRVALANAQKNYQNALTMDSEDDFMNKQLSFSGLSEVMKEIRIQIASDMRMPMTKLFGISSSGFNSGEDDIEVYNAMVESQVRHKCKYEILNVLEMCCQKLFRFIPEDIQINFKPLRILSSEQEENVKTQKLNRIVQAFQAGLISSKDAQDAMNKDNLLAVQIDAQDEIEPIEDVAKEEDAEENEVP